MSDVLPKEVRVRLSEIQQIIKSGDHDRAIDELKKLLEENPYPEVYNAVGFVYAQKGKFKEAVKYYQKGLKLNPKAGYIYSNLAFAYFKLNKWDLAEKILKKALSIEEKFEYYDQLSRVYLMKGDMDRALEAVNKSIQLNPGARILYDHKKEILDIFNKRQELKSYPKSLYDKARSSLKDKDYSEALDEIEFALEVIKRSRGDLGEDYEMVFAESILLRGEIKLNLDDLNGALKDLNRSVVLFGRLKRKDKQAFAHRLLSRCYSMMGGVRNLNRALKHITEAITLDDKPQYIYERAGIYIKLRKVKEAKKDMLKVIKHDPNNPYFHLRLGDVYAYLGDFDNALKEYNTAIKLNPLNIDAYDRKENLLLAKSFKEDIREIERSMYT